MGELPLTVDWAAVVYCDASSPSGLRWKVDRYRGRGMVQRFIVAGEPAGRLDEESGYWKVNADYSDDKAHRVVFFLSHGYMPEVVDHIDGNKSNNAIGNLRDVTKAVNARNAKKSVRNTSGIAGVNLEEIKASGKVYLYWRATVLNLDGVAEKKNFSVQKLGNDEAFRLACEYRAAKIEELNKQGAGYTERHGRDYGVEIDLGPGTVP